MANESKEGKKITLNEGDFKIDENGQVVISKSALEEAVRSSLAPEGDPNEEGVIIIGVAIG